MNHSKLAFDPAYHLRFAEPPQLPRMKTQNLAIFLVFTILAFAHTARAGSLSRSSGITVSNGTLNGSIDFNGSIDLRELVSGGNTSTTGGTITYIVPTAPKVEGPTSADVTTSSAILGGEVTSEGGARIIERGIVYAETATNSDPSIGGIGVTKVTATGTKGVFATVVTGLSGVTGYSFKAYATNEVGTSYTSVGTFCTAFGSLVGSFFAASDVPLTLPKVTIARGSTVTLSLSYAPVVGAELMVIRNTGLSFISGVFSNLTHGQTVTLTYEGVNYNFVANYYGGTGNDLVLVWKHNRVLAWGYNYYGQLGNNSTKGSNAPVAVTGILAGKTVVATSAGYGHSVALCSDGTLAAWGDNKYGQLGNGSTTSSNMPVAVKSTGLLSGKTVVAVSAGESHSLALCSDGTVAAWGRDGDDQLGYQNYNDYAPHYKTEPAAVVITGKTVVAVSAGGNHNLALCSDGTVVSWGNNFYGQLGYKNSYWSAEERAASAQPARSQRACRQDRCSRLGGIYS